jgi:hypothetical protein
MAGTEWVREERGDRGERKSCAKMIMHLERERARGWSGEMEQRVNEERDGEKLMTKLRGERRWRWRWRCEGREKVELTMKNIMGQQQRREVVIITNN